MDQNEGGNLEQIRDILFGAQARELNQGLKRIEDRLAKDLSALKNENMSRVDSLELFVKHEVQSLHDRLQVEQQERKVGAGEEAKRLHELGKELRGLIGTLDKKLAKLDDKLAKSDRNLRQHILDEAKNLRNDIEARHESQTEALAHEAQVLRESKTDRDALADLLKEMALRLTGESELASLEKRPK